MGDMADMILDGTVCGETGEIIDGDSPGYPRTMCDDKPDKRQRFEYALKRLKAAGFDPVVCSEKNFHIKVNGWSFWAWTGRIYHPDNSWGETYRGVRKFIQILNSKESN